MTEILLIEQLNIIKYTLLTQKEQRKFYKTNNNLLERLLTKEYISNVNLDDHNTYKIYYENKCCGFFTIKRNNTKLFDDDESDIIELVLIYIRKSYQCCGVASKLINDLINTMKMDNDHRYEYIIANSSIESVLFFIKNGFDFYEKHHKSRLDKSIIIMYKKNSVGESYVLLFFLLFLLFLSSRTRVFS
ncbi:MAG: GNAT family N-acetyltransferase [Methanosphaera sp.]|nr:GNAT family N-acetyltransferase [Methanosphaera sp.]